jgi:hypothetical protein
MLPAWIIDKIKKDKQPQGVHISDMPIRPVDEDHKDYVEEEEVVDAIGGNSAHNYEAQARAR